MITVVMREFTRLYRELDSTNSTNERVRALVRYFQQARPEDAAWATWFLSGNRPRRVIRIRQLQRWCSEIAEIPEWLFEACREFTGDLAETIALLLPDPSASHEAGLQEWVEERVLTLAGREETFQKQQILQAWRQLTQIERLVFNKLLTGGFRVGVSAKLVVRSLAEFSGVPAEVIAHRMMGNWQPSADRFVSLLSTDTSDTDISRPYPFCLAHPLPAETMQTLDGLADTATADVRELVTDAPDAAAEPGEGNTIPPRLGPVSDWIVEWKWDGIRTQLIVREGQVFLWSRGEELMTERFPELEQFARRLPDGTVLDGEVIGLKDGRILPFTELQRRVQRRRAGSGMQKQVPVQFLVFDVLEHAGVDIRLQPGIERRLILQQLMRDAGAGPEQRFALTEQLQPADWKSCADLRQTSRDRSVEGLMLKRRDAEYTAGRVTGVWWKWKAEPWNCDAVLLYAQRGHGRRGGRFTDFTFGVRDGDDLVPVARAYTGLTKAEIEEVDRFVRQNTLKKFGPVVSVLAELVFELAFEGLQVSDRHRSGLAVRFPRIVRWRRDKTVDDVDTLQSLRQLAQTQGGTRWKLSAENSGQGSDDKSTTVGPDVSGEKRQQRRKSSGRYREQDLFAGLDD